MEKNISTVINSDIDIDSDAEEFYKNYWQEGEKIKEERKELSNLILKRFFPDSLKNCKILEIGIGGEGGVLSGLMKENEVMGVDVSESAIKLCQNLGIKVVKLNMDTDKLPVNDNYFDVIFAFEVFEHFANPQHAIEEINRTLKENGVLLISTPNKFTYHWPRLFYPVLFEKENFALFLMINKFKVKSENDNYIVNGYYDTNLDDSEKGWSNYFYCNKIALNDCQAYFNIGMDFWNKRDENGLRLYPIEAVDCFRKSLSINNNLFVRCFYTRALAYRAAFNDFDEFNSNMHILLDFAESKNEENTNFVKFSLLMAELELKKFKLSVLSNEKFKEYLHLIINSGETNLIKEIKEDLNLVNKLYS